MLHFSRCLTDLINGLFNGLVQVVQARPVRLSAQCFQYLCKIIDPKEDQLWGQEVHCLPDGLPVIRPEACLYLSDTGRHQLQKPA